MKERPILFSGPMVRAILEGRKTVTRRAVKGNQIPKENASESDPALRWTAVGQNDSRYGFIVNGSTATECAQKLAKFGRCPHGQPGDRLWVRETWAEEHPLAVQEGRYFQLGRAGIPGPPGVEYHVIYRADGEPLQVWRRADHQHPYFTQEGPADSRHEKFPTVHSNYARGGKAIYWNPSIHMPRWASRILLEITAVRVERLQDITNEQAIAEGIGEPLDERYAVQDEFRPLWDSINGAGSWDVNPWVWVVEFKRVTP